MIFREIGRKSDCQSLTGGHNIDKKTHQPHLSFCMKKKEDFVGDLRSFNNFLLQSEQKLISTF